jgi:hypothetical protein
MKKLLLIILITGVIFSCDDNLEEVNTPRKRAQEVPAEPLFANGIREMFDLMNNTDVNINVFRLYAQYWAQTTYPDESQYNMVNRFIPDNFWTNGYKDVLMDLNTARQRIIETAVPEQLNLPDEQRDNMTAIIDVNMVYMYSILVDAFGAVPYSEALNPDILTPKYDAGEEVYNAIIAKLDDAISKLDPSADAFSSNQDLVFQGDVGMWKKFANSLKVRLAINISDKDAAKATTMINQALESGVFESGEKASVQYLPTPPNTNPLWEDLVQSGRHDFVVANTMVNKLIRYKDPRLSIYGSGRPIAFTKDDAGNYQDVKFTTPDTVVLYYPSQDLIVKKATPFTLSATEAETGVQTFRAGIYGSANAYSSRAHVGDLFHEPDLEGVIMDYGMVQFWLAEAVSKGLGITTDVTAEEYYNNGITASMNEWGITDQDAIDSYIFQPEVAFDAANWKQLVGTQEWLAQYNKPFEGWTTWRRLDFKGFNVPAGLAESDIPRRFIFPVEEATLNPVSLEGAKALVGGDNVQSKVFWDKF